MADVVFEEEQTRFIRMCDVTKLPIELCYQRIRPKPGTRARSEAEPLILICGMGEQMIAWHEDMCEMLVEQGFDVVRFDNRDVGHSTHLENADPLFGMYKIRDMADDVAALMDLLHFESAHIAGFSMGGMIAQLLAIHYPLRVRSMSIVMSSLQPHAERGVDPTPEVKEVFFSRPRSASANDIYTFRMKVWEVIYCPEGSFKRWKTLAEHENRIYVKRSPYFGGVVRHFLAITEEPSRQERLLSVDVPCVVVHGEEDGLVRPSEGKLIAETVPGAEWVLVPHMAHGFLPDNYGVVVRAIARTAQKAWEAPRAKAAPKM